MNRSEPLADPFALLYAARTALAGLPVTFAHSPFGPAPLHVQGEPDGSLARIDVYVAPGNMASLGADLTRAVHALPVWDAWLSTRPRPQPPCDWAWGYLHARKHHLPGSGVYLPRPLGELLRCCQHPDTVVTRARVDGVRAYLEPHHGLILHDCTGQTRHRSLVVHQ